MNTVAGQLFNKFTSEEIEGWVKVLKRLPTLDVRDNLMSGVDENNIMHGWFLKYCFSKIQKIFGDDLNLIFGMFLKENTPWEIHTDAYHCNGFSDRIPAMSFLIPYDVDDDKDLVEKVHTIVFNECSRDNNKALLTEDNTHLPNSAQLIYDQHLSHNSITTVNALTVQGVYKWKHNSIIYWDSMNYHDSDNFLKNGYKQKQAIVIHTYRNKTQ